MWKLVDIAPGISAESLLRRAAFTEAEICGYVSDDFELMSKASTMMLELPYLSNMMKIYSDGGVPH